MKIVYLIPINKSFCSNPLLIETYKWGGIVEIVHLGSGRDIGFDIGYACGAVHYKRGYQGAIVYRHSF